MFAISALLVSISATNFAYASYSSDDEDRKEKLEKEKELKKEKIEQLKQDKKELREEYKIKLEEKKKIFAEHRKELKEKYSDLKKEFKEKYSQLRISTVSEIDEDSEDKIESEIKRNELNLLKLEYREHIKNLKLESKQYFNELKHELKAQETDRKNKIHDKINELKEKYKDKIREHDHTDSSDLDNLPADYESKKIEICHVPPGNHDNAHTLHISVNAMKAHLAHGDYLEECDDGVGKQIAIKIEDGIAKIIVKIGDEELEFELEETNRDVIIQYIADNTDLTIEEIETYLEFEEDETDEGQTIHVELGDGVGVAQQ
jgi:DNA repair exonuclease SbcCD ATPase subunit